MPHEKPQATYGEKIVAAYQEVVKQYSFEKIINTSLIAFLYAGSVVTPARHFQVKKQATGLGYPDLWKAVFAKGVVPGLRTIGAGLPAVAAHRVLLFNGIPAIKGATHALIPENCPKLLYGPLASIMFGTIETAFFMTFDKNFAQKVLAAGQKDKTITYPKGMYNELFKAYGTRNSIATAPGFIAHGVKEAFPDINDKTLETAAFMGGFLAAALSLPADKAASLYLNDITKGVAQPTAVVEHIKTSLRAFQDMVFHALKGDYKGFSASAKLSFPGLAMRGTQIAAWNALGYFVQKDTPKSTDTLSKPLVTEKEPILKALYDSVRKSIEGHNLTPAAKESLKKVLSDKEKEPTKEVEIKTSFSKHLPMAFDDIAKGVGMQFPRPLPPIESKQVRIVKDPANGVSTQLLPSKPTLPSPLMTNAHAQKETLKRSEEHIFNAMNPF